MLQHQYEKTRNRQVAEIQNEFRRMFQKETCEPIAPIITQLKKAEKSGDSVVSECESSTANEVNAAQIQQSNNTTESVRSVSSNEIESGNIGPHGDMDNVPAVGDLGRFGCDPCNKTFR